MTGIFSPVDGTARDNIGVLGIVIALFGSGVAKLLPHSGAFSTPTPTPMWATTPPIRAPFETCPPGCR